MRSLTSSFALLFTSPLAIALAILALAAPTSRAAAQAPPVACTGLCQQQVSCPNGATTTITGTVYAPNGLDPLPNVIVYIPNATVDNFAPGVSCPVIGTPPSGSPLIGTTTAFDGTFVLSNVPVGSNIPLVIVTGRWRRQLTVSTVTACQDNPFSARMPRNQTEGDIPKFAIITGANDQVECVLRKVGIDDTEFTDSNGTGRINLFPATTRPGAQITGTVPGETDLMSTPTAIDNYDVLMLPCQGSAITKPNAELANLIQFANGGGRVYASHFSDTWMNANPPFTTVANWNANSRSTTPPNGTATVDQSFGEGQTLAKWLQLVGASTTLGQIDISTLRQDFSSINSPTQSYLALNNATYGNPVMQFVFDAPVGNLTNQCGRVLFNEYHVEDPGSTSPTGKTFPAECPQTPMNAQEKLLEYSLFELTNDGGQATLVPAAKDFGSQPVGFTSPSSTFTWTNNSTFPAVVTSVSTSGDFVVTGNGCGAVAPGASCQINAAFKPSVIGPVTGKLVVGTASQTLTSALSGTGIPDLSVSFANIDFGSVDVGASTVKTLTVTNTASGPVVYPGFLISGDFTYTSNCPALIPGGASCSLSIRFAPSVFGPRSGSLVINSTNAAYPVTPTALTGNGWDFTFALSPASGSVIAGRGLITQSTTMPLAGFNNTVHLTCTTNAPGASCVPDQTSFLPNSGIIVGVGISTTSEYTVIGYGGSGGGNLWLFVLALGSGWLVWQNRRSTRRMLQSALTLLILAALGFSATGCSGKLPAKNPVYTGPGDYTFTLTASDGIISHSATYALKVTTK